MARTVAALYDIHGNLPALQAVLDEVEDAAVDTILIGGDIGPGPMVPEVLDRLRALGERVVLIHGNADRELVAAFDRLRDGTTPIAPDIWQTRANWAAKKITLDQRDFLAQLPDTAVMDVDGLGAVLFCHGSPRSDEEVITPITSEQRLSVILADTSHSVVVCGHTHMQFDRWHQDKRIINAGSVGMPYEGLPGAYWALLGPDVSMRRTSYDFEAAADQIRAVGYPDAEEQVADLFVAPATRSEASAIFERSARDAGSR